MDVQRCPECGNRLQTNYCDICMKRVPFRGLVRQTQKDPWDSSSAHREEEGHTCISFETEAPKQKPVKTVTFPQKKKTTRPSGKGARILAIVVAVFGLLPALFGFLEEIDGAAEIPAPEPDYNYEAFVEGDVPGITATELYNDGEILITADSAGIYYDDYTLQLTIQNHSNRDVTVSTRLLSVNGYMADFGIYADIPEGETQRHFLQLYSYERAAMGITDVAEIAFFLDIFDSETYETIAATELLTLQTDIAQDYRQPVDDAGWEMHTDDALRVVYRGSTLSDYGDCDLHLYLENLSDENVSFTTNGIWINGEEVSGFLWSQLRPGTRAVDSIYIYGLEELEITQFSQITEVYLEYTVDRYEGEEIVDTAYCTALFNPNALPTSD